jgi:hypothetical protein
MSAAAATTKREMERRVRPDARIQPSQLKAVVNIQLNVQLTSTNRFSQLIRILECDYSM